ncbi:MAG TPA: helix-turn-helix transcriptional regulator [Actinomycetota bacterium]|nr:helix-turn-helix transcriptional regulator [Actinomycetota bacterium]
MAERDDERRRNRERAVYIISVAAELSGVHPQTLRIYERRGLLAPARTSGNTRRYSERDIERLREIQQLTQEHGVNLAGVKMIMELERELERLRGAIEEMRRQMAAIQRRSSAAGALVRRSEVADLLAQLR